MKILPVGAELFNVHGWAERMMKLRVAFCNFAKQPNKCINSQVRAVRCDTDKVGLPTIGKPTRVPTVTRKPAKFRTKDISTECCD